MHASFAAIAVDHREINAVSSTRWEAYDPGTQRDAAPAARTFDRALTGPVRRKRPSAQDDASLVERLRAGDEAALETLVGLYSAKLYNVAHRILGNAPDTEEVIQDVFWTACRKVKSFKGNSQFSTWLYRLTVNAALGKLRRAKKNKDMRYEEFLPKFQDDGHHAARPVVDWSNSLDEQYAQQELQRFLQEALDLLKPIDKSVVVLSDLEGMSGKEIAALLGVTVAAVKTRLHRARLFLRGKLTACLGYSAR